ncbi:HypC/HybG/HupF family hydrogenase formation chaperone [Corynebacterium sp. 153RC1]|uniref:HypC/HybG/HupF family hydrogenase formation chaperone n=1 Tax=Corynebacterium TaxID=1716 RepID=UPI00211C49E1|nr:HypC/HybG/HupF family hydrogenase formation chaperone [Corynebacterium sp. 76QC2CO]MCQ9352636.1 HypC/HybG/HupF family hydrogenase formation chaperone [Corynebacterium sp. 209RC1]MCQ9354820.1 HypC/HybG/HupF family hydrogenase formation chaperone [Corynebacterium sp. 1222RC1]MCQ9357005.1 HypC/HybG/HupF family hydrogenase formation chaperone [Corynebacterium sp. 122RC1]MCQ9359088.1 HypC/HybG/HupF family hydrogenase formation chaperone [Corynebacterium sp. 142RC1]MCQ9361473.1 HypC/HybG/HupF fam
MCLGVPAQVVEISDPTRATVSIDGVSRKVSTDLLLADNLSVGDWVLVHVGFALSVIDEDEAQLTLQQIKQLGADTFEDELDSFKQSQIE